MAVDGDDAFIEMPDIVPVRLFPFKTPSAIRTEFDRPTSDSLMKRENVRIVSLPLPKPDASANVVGGFGGRAARSNRTNPTALVLNLLTTALGRQGRS